MPSACTREQAKICHSYIAGYFTEVPLLKPLVKYISDTDGYIELKNGVEIIVATNSYRAVRGKTVAVCTLKPLVKYISDTDGYIELKTVSKSSSPTNSYCGRQRQDRRGLYL